jgi:hypothetical protein
MYSSVLQERNEKGSQLKEKGNKLYSAKKFKDAVEW